MLPIKGEVPLLKDRPQGCVFQNRCSHAEASLSEGEVYDCKVECPLHGAEFDLKTGEALTLPATKPIATYTTEVNENSLLVKELKDA